MAGMPASWNAIWVFQKKMQTAALTYPTKYMILKLLMSFNFQKTRKHIRLVSVGKPSPLGRTTPLHVRCLPPSTWVEPKEPSFLLPHLGRGDWDWVSSCFSMFFVAMKKGCRMLPKNVWNKIQQLLTSTENYSIFFAVKLCLYLVKCSPAGDPSHLRLTGSKTNMQPRTVLHYGFSSILFIYIYTYTTHTIYTICKYNYI